MSDRSNLRLAVLGVLLFSLVLTMLGRLVFLQVVSADLYTQIGARNAVKTVTTPAARGLIVDQAGRPLAGNRTSLVVSLDRATIEAQPDKGEAVLTKLAGPLGTTYEALAQKIQLCGTKGATPGVCWSGNPFQPIPVAKDVSTSLALSIMERRADFPGVLAQLETVRQYPLESDGTNAAQLLGYLGAVSQSELDAQAKALKDGTITAAQATLTGTDQVGRSGLEAEYDEALRGTPGVKKLNVDIRANVLGVASETDPVPGDTLVTNIDAKLQAVVEQQLEAAVKRARNLTDSKGKPYVADSGAAVVLDVKTGAVLAMASYPTYDPSVWVGGISSKEYTNLTRKKSNLPLLNRVTQGLFHPASTFKIATTSAALMRGFSMDQKYNCPSELTVGGRKFRNNESADHGMITFKEAIEVSCDTIYYNVADKFWKQQGGLSATAEDPVTTMAQAYGMGRRTGIDLPSEYAGQVGGRKFQAEYAAKYRDDWCANKDNPKYSPYQRAVWTEHCADGYPYQVGNAVNTAIGQGDTSITPLQVAQAYAALANGGTIYEPHVAKAVMSPSGQVVKEIKPKKTGKLPVSKSVQDYLRSAFEDTTKIGTAEGAFIGFPFAKVGGIASKTGTAQADGGKQSTSWFASYAPAKDPQYAVVMMVSQGGMGVTTSGPSVRKIYESIFGVTGSKVDPSKSVFVGGAPKTTLPTFDADGNPVYPELGATGGTGSGDPAGVGGAPPSNPATPADDASPDKRKNRKNSQQASGP